MRGGGESVKGDMTGRSLTGRIIILEGGSILRGTGFLFGYFSGVGVLI
jgi:hypothetical protein